VDPSYGDFRARREATVWQRLNRVVLVLLALAALLVVVSLFVPMQKRLSASGAENDKLEGLVNDQKRMVARLNREVTLLRTDATYLETIARDRLDLMKEGETVFRLEQAQAAKSKTAESKRR
jgi:cell division protein FtsB